MKYKKIMIKTIYDIPEHIFKTSYQNATIGHVLTPPKLALEMIQTLPSDFIKNEIKILDPACKNGSFLFQIVIKQLDNDWTVKDIENSLYTCDTLMASLNVAESGIKHIIRFTYQNSLVKVNNLLYKYPSIELVYDELIKTITKNKYISIRQFINELLLDRKNNWLIVKFEENLIEFIKKYEGLSKTESKLFGEVFTPQALIEEMLDTLPADVWTNKDLKWLDPAVGIGNFPAAVLNRLMTGLEEVIVDEDERRKWILEEMLYMGDISTKNLFLLYQLFDANNEFKLNVFRGDFLSEKFDKHMRDVWGLDGFDLVVGNPPYNDEVGLAGGGKNLYSKFISKSFDILKLNGFISIVTNAGILKSTDNKKNDILSKLLNGNLSHLNINECKKHFPGVGGAMIFCYFTFENNNTYIETNVISQIDEKSKIYTDIVSFKELNFIPRISTKISISIIKKFMTNQYNFIRKDGVENFKIESDLIGFKRLSHLVTPYNVKPSSEIDKGTWILTKSNNIKNDIIFFNSKEFSFINLIHRYDPIIYHKMISVFGKNKEELTPEEIQLIEETISEPKKKKSKKK